MTASTHAPSFLQIADARRQRLRDQQLLQALGDDRLAHRLAGASRATGRTHGRHGRTPTTPGRPLSPSMARWRRCRRKAMPSAARCWNAAATGRDVVQRLHRRPEPHPLDASPTAPSTAFCSRWPDGQSGLRAQDLVRRAQGRRRARFGLSAWAIARDDSYLRICFAQDPDAAGGRAVAHRARALKSANSQTSLRCDVANAIKPPPRPPRPACDLIAFCSATRDLQPLRQRDFHFLARAARHHEA